MLTNKIFLILIIIGLTSFFMGCTAPETKMNTDKKPIIGGVAVGISPKVIYADRGENVSFNVDLQSTENDDDELTININGSWINQTLMQDIKASGSVIIPMKINVPDDAINMTYKVIVVSSNINSISRTTGVIFINNKR